MSVAGVHGAHGPYLQDSLANVTSVLRTLGKNSNRICLGDWNVSEEVLAASSLTSSRAFAGSTKRLQRLDNAKCVPQRQEKKIGFSPSSLRKPSTFLQGWTNGKVSKEAATPSLNNISLPKKAEARCFGLGESLHWTQSTQAEAL